MRDLLIWIPARGGSKRVRGKNLRTVGNCSLLGRTIWFAREFRRRTAVHARIIVDTDDQVIAEEALSWGAEVPFLREEEYASDTATSVDALLRLLARLEESGDDLASAVMLLQPTSPLRTYEHCLACWEEFNARSWARLLSVRGADLEHAAGYVPDEEGSLQLAGSSTRSPIFCPTGALYLTDTSDFRDRPGFVVAGATGFVAAEDWSVVDVDEEHELALADRALSGSRPAGTRCLVIAEAGVNHGGSVDRALELVRVAATAGADAVKFQTFEPASLVARSAPKAPYQIAQTGAEEGQWEMLARLVLSEEDHHVIAESCRDHGIRFLSTPFDAATADRLVAMGVDLLKISSAEVTNWPFLRHLGGLRVPVILSTGMSTLQEVADAVEVLRKSGCEDLSLLHCVSSYPSAAEDSNLHSMQTMASLFDVPVGWSDHTEGITVGVAAVAMGAVVLEKHFTLDRSLPGPDHLTSVEPQELADLVRSVRQVEAARGSGVKRPVPAELPVAAVARRSLHGARRMAKGDRLDAASLVALRPGTGISPVRLSEVEGRTLLVSLDEGEMLTEEHLG